MVEKTYLVRCLNCHTEFEIEVEELKVTHSGEREEGMGLSIDYIAKCDGECPNCNEEYHSAYLTEYPEGTFNEGFTSDDVFYDVIEEFSED